MRLPTLVLIALAFSSCAKESHQAPQSSAPVLASAPSCVFYVSGSRTFCNGVNTTSDAYDCGMSEGKHCWKFVHTPDVNDAGSYEDFVCVEPFSSGDECANKLP